jgi:hypothetical protein
MTILGEVRPEVTDLVFKTSYNDLYSGMIRVPFFGHNYNVIMPFFIIVFGIGFALMSFLQLRNRALLAMKKY